MKTPIIQHEPDEPSTPESRVEPPDESGHPTNLAGRMGRWSAQHRKTAIFGWLAFVVVAFALGIVSGTTKIDQATSGVGESGRIDKLLQEFVQPAGESVLIQSDTLTVKDPAFTAAVEDVIARVSAVDVVMDVKSPLDPENAGQIGQAGMQRAHRLRDPRRSRRRRQEDRPRRCRGRRGAGGQSRRVHRLVRRQRRQGDRGRLPGRPQEGRAGSIPVTLIILIVVFELAAAIPPARARPSWRRRFGLVAADLLNPDRRGDVRADPPHRARGRRRLLDVLLEARTRGARRRAQRGGGARSGRSHLRPLRADLRADVIIAMSGMFLAGVQGMSAFALGTILVVAVAMLGSLTVLPATLSWLGDRRAGPGALRQPAPTR